MSKKVLLIVSVFALVFAFGVVNVSADSGTTGSECTAYNSDAGVTVAIFCDGRLNSADMTQSVAVYYTHASIPTGNWDSVGQIYTDVITGIQLWAIDGDGVGQPVLTAPVAAINQAIANGVDTQIAGSNGYTVNYSHTGYFWVSAPDGYTFTWAAW